ncbi:hypothetical protein [Neorhizobium petrolearium]|uniref:Uncharacterized protein n=1 Tax=Neorhizobium petrolearium TaxID=515361 RepID=A0ABY8MAN2_9HYPH|nr:hypothetical protein [Neorhizobium petrolearium]MCC2610747.1 hypothetical protein [Neorhizobium petrolearium]WGI70871.1 hypothetical protein QEO92_12925 [Neorhizobium petrolearium]
MTKLEQIEKSVSELDPKELESFSTWFEEFQAARWDEQIDADSAAGKLDALADRALADFRSHADYDRLTS